ARDLFEREEPAALRRQGSERRGGAAGLPVAHDRDAIGKRGDARGFRRLHHANELGARYGGGEIVRDGGTCGGVLGVGESGGEAGIVLDGYAGSALHELADT